MREEKSTAPDVVYINDLPVVIKSPGDYATRDGRRVTIREIRETAPGTTAFTAKGSVWKTMRGSLRARGHDIWHISGRHMAVGESARDIVGPYAPPK